MEYNKWKKEKYEKKIRIIFNQKFTQIEKIFNQYKKKIEKKNIKVILR